MLEFGALQLARERVVRRWASLVDVRNLVWCSKGARPPDRGDRLAVEELEQVGVELVLVRGREPMGRARVRLQLGVRDELRGPRARVRERDDLVVLAVDDERRDVEPLQVLGEIRLGEGLDAVVRALSPPAST